MNDENEHMKGPAGRLGRPEQAGWASGDPLAARAHRVLRQLPGRRAPATLAPRVLAELVRRTQLIWYRRPWTDWPESMRWLSTFVLAGIVAGSLRLLEDGWTATKSSPALTPVQDVPVFLSAAETFTRSLINVLHTLPPAWGLVGAGALIIAAVGTFGLGTAAWRLARSSTR